ncbi:MAG: hypothetical protein WCG36_07375 [bacterium]
MKCAALIFGGLILASILCMAEGGRKAKQEHWVIDGAPAEWAGESTSLGWLTNLPIQAGNNIKVTSTPTGTVVAASLGDVTNHYGWIPADYLYSCPRETLSNENGQAEFTKHDMTKSEFAGPISCPAPMGYSSNVTFQWFTYHSNTGTYAMACRWREGGLKAWTCATSGLFEASTTLTNLSMATLTAYAPAPDSGLIEMEYWVVPTNAPGGGSAGGFGYVRGMKIEFWAKY